MEFPKGYSLALTLLQIKRHFPNLIDGKNFKIESLKTEDYNCVAWSIELKDDWIEFPYDENGNYDDNVNKYIDYFESIGYSKTENASPEKEKLKIAIYHDENKEFKHVARLLPEGKWTSKIGDWEDIEHNNLEALAGRSYGNSIIIMEKKIVLDSLQ